MGHYNAASEDYVVREIANFSWDCRILYQSNTSFRNDEIVLPDLILWTLFTATMTIGNAFLIAVIYHERFGGDPQKRCLQNRLASKVHTTLQYMMNAKPRLWLCIKKRFIKAIQTIPPSLCV